MTTMQKLITRSRFAKAMLGVVAAPMLLWASVTHSAPVTVAVTANVLSMGQYGNGHIFVLIDQTITQPDCPAAARFDVDGTHPNIKAILATLMLAKSNSTPIRVATYGCFTFSFNSVSYSFPTLDASDQSFVRLMQ